MKLIQELPNKSDGLNGLGEPISATTITAIATGVMSLYKLGADYNKGVENDRIINSQLDADVFSRVDANRRDIRDRLVKGEAELMAKQIEFMRAGGTLNAGLGGIEDFAGIVTSLASVGSTIVNADAQKATAQANAQIADSRAKAAASQAYQQELIANMVNGKSENTQPVSKDNTVLYVILTGLVIGTIATVAIKTANKKSIKPKK
jgi:hypothetical protein